GQRNCAQSWHRNRIILRGGGSKSALKSARLAANRTPIKRATTVSIAIPISVPYAYRNRKPTIRSAPVVVNSNKEVLMAARAMWKGELKLGTTKVPVKLYSAVQDRTVRFHV